MLNSADADVSRIGTATRMSLTMRVSDNPAGVWLAPGDAVRRFSHGIYCFDRPPVL